jgi:polysaccharide biosynthesis protein PslH
MKLVFLTSRFPFPLEKGDKLRSYFFLRELSRYHEICLISLNETNVPDKHIRELEKIVSSVHVFPLSRFSRYLNAFIAVFLNRPIQAGYFYNCRTKKKIKEIIEREKPDHLFAQLLRTALYVRGLKIPKTLDYQDVFSWGVKRRISGTPFPFRLVLMLEYQRLKRFEERVFNWFDHKIIITETDRALMPVAEKQDIHIVANGVDTDYFDAKLFSAAPKKYDIIFTGNMGYPPNVNCAIYIAEKILPLLKIKHPEIKIVFAGANPHHSLKRLSGRNIEVTGWVEDMRQYYASSKIFLAPMQIGTGLQNKLLEAMAMNLPCITSDLANSALGATHGKEILVGNSSEEIAAQIDTLLYDSGYADEIAGNGHKFVSNHFSWKTMGEKLNKIIENRTL